MSEFNQLNLVSSLRTAIQQAGFQAPTPIQSQAIPHLLDGHDLLGIAQTGTGKTAAFVLPILNRLISQPRRPRAGETTVLILTPTRELASQIGATIEAFSATLPIRHTVIFGGVGQYLQAKAMSRGVHILVATPGRLLDLINQGIVRLASLQVFVLDEADRMLDMGFIHDIRRVIALLPADRQTLLFSATMPPEVEELTKGILRDPVRVEVTPQSTTVEKVDQKVLFVNKENKRALLKKILEQQDIQRALVFTRTKHGADRVTEHLEKNAIPAMAIHGNKSQSAREKSLELFRNGEVRVLVATDIAARGIDVAHISHVINFDLPNEPESYVHRIGRTARAGNDGQAISFCDASESPYLRDIERIIRQKVPVDRDHRYHCEIAAGMFPEPQRGPSSARRQAPTPTRSAAPAKGRRPPPVVARHAEQTARPQGQRNKAPRVSGG
ncbi:ATP-dependent RNA helicase RhlE [Candidatus Magnetaquicoccaceae bacterium FCR-1]|uniref:ATP-dependent RNA helicase RhlE n=1 Tax=Candidatus Magnetaquiglobus chichijimensis TaxID=3141448 RepID=A0ABQ0C5T0_9PROT